ncbi:MAG TPA: pantoate--beta-alanine ligase [Motilibacteraceae bacterium]|nr:pantoate--beta-alanine ligase [Motilibacteraceae bacterium]
MAAPRVARTREELRALRDAAPGEVAVVMTMGALHEGHAQLVREARQRAATVVVTIFLNPLQFAAGEDLSRYPRTFESDLALCTREGVDIVFAPAPDVVYPEGDPLVRVAAGPLGDVLEGEHRPGHFDGVLTVVLKLFHLVRPDVAYFGQKDAQQLLLIRRMARDLDVGVEVVAVPTVREDDGLALSSRNTYLSSEDHRVALALSRALNAGSDASSEGAEAVRKAAQAVLDGEPGVHVDYLALADAETLAPVPADHSGPALLLVAARVGSTRLIDNLPLLLGNVA